MGVSIFIDGNNFYFGLKRTYQDKSLSDFNFERFCDFLAHGEKIVSVFYYNAPLDRMKDFKKYQNQQKFFEKLRKIPKFNVILCSLLKRQIRGTETYYYVLKEDDIHMAVDLVKGAYTDRFDEAIIVSGDGDFVPEVKVAQEKKKKILNACFKKSASTNLKKNCDGLIKLNKLVLDKFFEK